MYCAGGSHIITTEGYWSHLADRTKAYKCAPAAPCLGGEVSLCEDGYSGRVCGICDPGYMRTNGQCISCEGIGIYKPMITLGVLLVLSLIVGAIIWMCMQYDPHGEENKILALSRTVDVKKAKYARAAASGDPQRMATTKAELKRAIEQLEQALQAAEDEAQQHGTDKNESYQANPLALGPGVSASSTMGKGAASGAALEDVDAEGAMEGVEDFDLEGIGDLADGADDLADLAELGSAFEELSVTSKILLGYCQCLTVSTFTMPSVPWPQEFSDAFVSIFSFLSLDMMNLIPMGCYTEVNFYSAFMLSIWTPVLLCGLVIGALFIKLALDKKNGKHGAVDDCYDKMWKFNLLVLFILYPSVSTRVCSIFDCREIHGKYWLRSDVQLECYDEVWSTYATVGAAAVLVYPMGVPMFFFIVMYRNLNRLQEPGMKSRFGFLYSGFMIIFWYGELLEMIRKFFMSAFILFVAPGSLSQIGMGLFVATVFLGIHLYFNPYESAVENRCQTICLWGSFLTLLVGFLMTANGCSTGGAANGESQVLPPALMFVNMFAVAGTAIIAFAEILAEHFENVVEMIERFSEEVLEPMLEEATDPEEMGLQDDEFALSNPLVLGGAAAAGAVAATTLKNRDYSTHLLQLSEKLFDFYRADVDRGIDRHGFLRFMNRWDHNEFRSLGETEPLYQKCTGGLSEINEVAFKLFVCDPEMFGRFNVITCQYALEAMRPDNTGDGVDGVPVLRSLWITQLFNMHARGNSIGYQAFHLMMTNFSPSVNAALVKATYKKMAEIPDENSLAVRKRRMADAIRANGTQMDELENDAGIFTHGITLQQFTKWAASVFVNCDSEEFVEGIVEMMKDGAEERRTNTNSRRREEESDDDEEEQPVCGPVKTCDLPIFWEQIATETRDCLGNILTQSRYSIWRSLKGRQLTVDMHISAKLIFEDFCAQVEHQRRKLTKETNPLVLAETWPPQDAEDLRVAREVLLQVFDRFDESQCADIVRKKLILEYIPQVNRDTYASQTLKDQMQALVLATSEVLVETMSKEAFSYLLSCYEVQR
jgi:hypothetical protein